MTLQKLNEDLVSALKNKDTVTKDVLRSAIGSIKKAAIDGKYKDDIPEKLVDDVLLKEQKTLQEMIDTCPSDRIDLMNEYKSKKLIIDKYAPKLVTDETEINHIIYNICKGESFANIGEAMKFVMPQLKGKVDMKIANKVLKEMTL